MSSMAMVALLAFLFPLVPMSSLAAQLPPMCQPPGCSLPRCPRPGLPSESTCYYTLTVVDVITHGGATRVRARVDPEVVKRNAVGLPEGQKFDPAKYPDQVYTFRVKDLDKLNLQEKVTYTFVSKPTNDFDAELELYQSK